MTKVAVTFKQEIDMDWETAQPIVVAFLKEDFDTISADIEKLRRKSFFEELKSYQKEDLANWMATRDAIYNVLRYYTTPEELDSFMRNRSLL